MCVKLNNKRHCLTALSLAGLLQLLIALPIIIVSFIVFARTDLGAALSPFWAGFLVSYGVVKERAREIILYVCRVVCV